MGIDVIKDWMWMGRYLLVIVIALLLGAAIGELSLFKQTTLGTPKLTAAKVAQFLGYGGALLLFWLLAQRAGRELYGQGGRARFVSFVVLPLATLIIVLIAYNVLLILGGALMSQTVRKIYNWIFVLGTTASAIWLAVALFRHADSMLELLRPGSAGRGRA